jgi:16S rRNA (guanine1516-N2)-methyltransferase
MIVTTAPKPSEMAKRKAARLAAELGAALVQRRGATVRQLVGAAPGKQAIVVTEHEVRFYDGEDAKPLFFHPSMAFIRVKRLRDGGSDPLVEWSRCKPGDVIIDCTAGMAGDSLVLSYAAGEAGTVTALESGEVLSALVREGLSSYRSGLHDVDEAMRRITLVTAAHLEYLASRPDKSADIVYFDPMFRKPVYESSAISAFRPIANGEALSEEAVFHARRVARKTVIMKEHGASGEFQRLGFTPCLPGVPKITYGVIHVD